LCSAAVSREHAWISWSPTGWEIRDLGSHNGTWVDGERLPPGTRAPLVEGVGIGFGGALATHRLSDGSPPEPLLRAADGTWIEGRGGLLDIPGAEGERVLLRDPAGRWIVEERGSPRALTHGEALVLAGVEYRVHLPSELAQTLPFPQAGLPPPTARFRVSRDEEEVELVVVEDGRVYDLGSRAHHYLLLVLARHRLADELGGRPSGEHGWIDAALLARQLRHDNRQVNLLVHRARRQAADAGLLCAHALVERRERSRQLRLGPVAIEIEP
jgi:hypothetical protein